MEPHTPVLLALQSIARLERAGVRPPRLTEPGHVSWLRIRRSLRWVDFIAILFQDLATAFPYPFDLARWEINPLRQLPEFVAQDLLAQAMMPDLSDPLVFLRNAAKSLDFSIQGAIADLPRVQPHQRVLELPGSFGRIAAQQVLHNPTLAFHEQFTFVADTDEGRLLIGLAAVEMRSNEPRIVSSAELLSGDPPRLSDPRIDRAFGLRDATALDALLDPHVLEIRRV